MKFRDKFEKKIESIYSKQKARVIINGEITNSFKITKGVRQGCPRSPLLFILTLEFLLQKIRQKIEIKGTKIKQEEFKVQGFADDMVFVIEDPLESGPILLQEIEKGGCRP